MNISYLKIMHWATNFAPLCNSITCQSIVLESCSNPQNRLGQPNNYGLKNDSNSNFSLIYWKLQCSNFNSNLISGFANNATLSNSIFKDQTRVHPRARTVRQNGHKCHFITWKAKAGKIQSISFFIHSCSTSYVTLSMNIIMPHCLSTHTQKLE